MLTQRIARRIRLAALAAVLVTAAGAAVTSAFAATSTTIVTGPVYDNGGTAATLTALVTSDAPEQMTVVFELAGAQRAAPDPTTGPPVGHYLSEPRTVSVDGPTPAAWAIHRDQRLIQPGSTYRFRAVATRASGDRIETAWASFTAPPPTGGGLNHPPAMCRTPGVLGATRAAAIRAMRRAGCDAVNVAVPRRRCRSRVARQQPAAGTRAPAGAPRTIVLRCVS